MSRTKYNSKRTIVDGVSFHSKGEAERYKILKVRNQTKQIRELQLQPVFKLYVTTPEGKQKQVCTYRPDFMYIEHGGNHIVEDHKGVKTALYQLKKKMFMAQYPEYIFRETTWATSKYDNVKVTNYIQGKKVKP